ncbi:MAG: dephospho-CoA kinase [Phycisphaerae bacterium]|nr:dephospho-CoA kinase [Phycisphaerae bacterium]
MNSLPVIGIVGGIGSGKSVVASMFREEGCVVSDSDLLAHAALGDPAVRDTLVSWWGPSVLSAAGTIDRGAVGRIVFANTDERRRLEGVIHPWIGRERERAFAAALPSTRACVIDAPLLFEAGLRDACNLVVFVDATRAVRLNRVKSRGWNEAELARRESAQWNLDRKRAVSDIIIRNEGDLVTLREQVRAVLAKAASA